MLVPKVGLGPFGVLFRLSCMEFEMKNQYIFNRPFEICIFLNTNIIYNDFIANLCQKTKTFSLIVLIRKAGDLLGGIYWTLGIAEQENLSFGLSY